MEQVDRQIFVPSAWKKLAQDIQQFDGLAKVFILGGVDTGKTALAIYLAYTLSRQVKTGLLDIDPGQSIIGPPSTAGLVLLNERNVMLHFPSGLAFFENPLVPDAMTCVGSTTPVGHLVQSIVGAKKLLDTAIRFKTRCIVINSSGLVHGDMAREFKFQKMDLLRPTHIIALEKERELIPVLKNFYARKSVSITRLKIIEAVRPKSQEQRADYRVSAFRNYFKDSHGITLSLRSLGLHGHIPNFYTKNTWEKLIIGLCDKNNFARAFGVIQHIDCENNMLYCLTPLKESKVIRSIHFGSIKMPLFD